MDDMKIFNNRTQQDFDIYSHETEKKTHTVCGRSKNLNIGDVIEFSGNGVGLCVKEIERRDHRGVFKNPEDKKNSFFTVTCKEVEMRDIYEQLKQEEEENGTK